MPKKLNNFNIMTSLFHTLKVVTKAHRRVMCIGGATALMLTTSACFSQNPAPYVDKSNLVFARSGQKHRDEHHKVATHAPLENTAFESAPPRPDSEIIQAPLQPLEGTAPAQEKLEEKAPVPKQEESKPVVHDVNKLTDIDLEKQIDNKALNPVTQKPEPQASVGNAYKTKTPLNSPKFDWPIDGKVLSHYGKLGNKFNEGINVAAPLGAPVAAASDGKVVYIGNNVEGYGNLLIIRHDGDLMTAYAHLREIVVERGASVKRGESVGSIGQVGNVTQPQLHFSIRKGKKTVDPELALN